MDKKLAHLEMIQGIVNRLSHNSFLLKGWSVVIVSALLALSANQINSAFSVIALLPALVFWALDGYFLGMERRFRHHYDNVRKLENDEQVTFSMAPPGGGFGEWVKATFSKTLIPFHFTIVVAILVAIVLSALNGAKPVNGKEAGHPNQKEERQS
jgi:hypothetical protein